MFHKARDYLLSIRKKAKSEYDLKKYQFIDYIKTNKNNVIMKLVLDFTIFYISNGVSKCYTRVSKVSDDIMLKINYISENLNGIISLKHFSFALKDLFVGIAVVVLFEVYFYYKNKNAKKTRKGEEHGSARWGRKSDIINFQDLESYENNILLTQTESIRLNGRIKPKFQRNKNILVIGGSGSGKTRFFIKPNLMQMHSSYVVTDPKGTVVLETGKMLENAGYKIKILNTLNLPITKVRGFLVT